MAVTVRSATPRATDPRTAGELRADLSAQVLASVRVEVADHALAERVGVPGVVLAVSRADGGRSGARVAMELDYSGFAHMFGGGYGSRLRAVTLPACALSTPDRAECRGQVPVPGAVNDAMAQKVLVDGLVIAGPGPADAAGGVAEAGPVVLALVPAAASMEAGDFSRTSLAPSYSWAQGANGGEFSTSVALSVPPSLGGPTPDLALRYSSGSVDGRTWAANAQASWVGEGWDLQLGYIERSFRACSDDGRSTGDLCWLSDPSQVGRLGETLNLVLNGRATKIIQDDGGTWRAVNDDGLRILRGTGASNSDDNGEFWEIIDQQGVRYLFGRNHTGDGVQVQGTNSVAVVPVFGNNAGEPRCGGNEFCHQAYRWHLDYVVDPHGNTMSLFYGKTTGRYGYNNNPATTALYDVNIVPAHIEYGTRQHTSPPAPAPMRVDFAWNNRCTETGQCQVDVPWDRYCEITATRCDGKLTPTFWIQYALDSVTTKVWDTAVGGYREVDRWELEYTYPDPGFQALPALWLHGITRVGLAGPTPVREPQAVFHPVSFPNRVGGVGSSLFFRHRLAQIDSGSGRRTRVLYHGQQCGTVMPQFIDHNGMLCFPQAWSPPPGGGAQQDGWFHKYPVHQVIEVDLTGGGPDEYWTYDYSENGSTSPVKWRFDDNEQVPVGSRSWDQWRGYSTVTVHHGQGAGQVTSTRTLYYRGMHRDRTGAGDETRTASLSDALGAGYLDEDHLAGTVRQVTTLENGADASYSVENPQTVQTGVRTRPWHSGTIRSYRILPYQSVTRTRVNATGTWRTTDVLRSFDTLGLPVEERDRGDLAVVGDETCTSTSYARTGSTVLVSFPAEVRTRAGENCASGTVLAYARSYYDGAALGSIGSRGLATRVEALMSTGPDVWATTAAGYDSYGRTTSSTDARGQTTTTAYTPAEKAAVRQVTVANSLRHTTTTTTDGLRGQPIAVLDPNGKTTTAAYDALGRLTKVWRPGRPIGATADVEYGYQLNNNAANAITTTRLGPTGNRITTYELLDGRFRTRQIHAPAPPAHGGRIVTDVAYDGRGLAWKTSTFHVPGLALISLLSFNDADIARQTRTVRDTVERVTAEQTWSAGVKKWETTYTHDGDRISKFPPVGGASRTEWDTGGRPVALRVYPTGATSGTPETTTYRYDPLGNLTRLTDPAGNQTTYTYDLGGRRVSTDDPDTGTTTTVYGPAGDVLSATDWRGQKVSSSYDALGRVTARWAGEAGTGTRLATFSYDSLAKGYPTAATRYAGSAEYVTAVAGYTDAYQPTGQTWSIPLGEGALAGTYGVKMTYNQYTGAPATLAYETAQHGLPAETLTYGYDTLGYPTTLNSGLETYVASTAYTRLAELAQRVYGAGTGPGRLSRDYSYDTATGRLASLTAKTPVPAAPTTWQTVQHDSYTYNPTGDITAIKDNTDGQSQCYRHDAQHRLTEAWTAVDNCAADPSTAALAGSGKHPYWDSWTFDSTGRRDSDTHRTTTGATGRRYHYPATGADRVHAATSVTVTGAGAGTDTFGYDNAGNMSTRTVGGVSTDYTFNPENQFTRAVVHTAGGDQETRHLYDASGGLLIRREPGATTLYAAGQEFRLPTTAGGTVTGTRYYSHGGATIAARTGPANLTWLAADHQGSANLAVDKTTGQITRRWYTPYGADRTTVAWPTDRGFLGKQTNPSTGLIDMGAREYDPTYGTFISPDPLVDNSDPRTFHPYAYSAHSPVTRSDPSGLDPGGNCGVAGTCNEQVDACNNSTTGTCAGIVPKAYRDKVRAGSSLSDQDREDRRKAEEIKKKSAVDFIIENGLKFLLDFLGITDIVNCFTKGDLGACVNTAMNLIPVTKIFSLAGKLGKGLWKAFKAYKAWKKAVEWADEVIARTDDLLAKLVKKADDNAPASCTHSFHPDTPVRMADGTHKPIRRIQIGDQVQATDPDTGQTSPQDVVDTHTNSDVDLTDLTITVSGIDGGGAGGSGPGVAPTAPPGPETTVLYTTQHHPFWSATRDAWIDAADLQPGEQLHTDGYGSATVAQVVNHTGIQTMHDLTVDRIHAYYVVAGSMPVLVHNCGTGVNSRGEPCTCSNPAGSAGPRDLTRTHSIGGRSSSRWVSGLVEDMRANGYTQAPIAVVVHEGSRYVVDGHHRLAAASRAGIRSVPIVEVQLPFAGYHGVDDLVGFVEPDNLRNRGVRF
jgi:RHS repeat-associated protein